MKIAQGLALQVWSMGQNMGITLEFVRKQYLGPPPQTYWFGNCSLGKFSSEIHMHMKVWETRFWKRGSVPSIRETSVVCALVIGLPSFLLKKLGTERKAGQSWLGRLQRCPLLRHFCSHHKSMSSPGVVELLQVHSFLMGCRGWEGGGDEKWPKTVDSSLLNFREIKRDV